MRMEMLPGQHQRFDVDGQGIDEQGVVGSVLEPLSFDMLISNKIG